MKILSLIAVVFGILGGVGHISAGHTFDVWVYPFTGAIWAFLFFLEASK